MFLVFISILALMTANLLAQGASVQSGDSLSLTLLISILGIMSSIQIGMAWALYRINGRLRTMEGERKSEVKMRKAEAKVADERWERIEAGLGMLAQHDRDISALKVRIKRYET